MTLGRISAENLVEVNVLLKQFLQKKKTPKSDILEFAGIWKDDFDNELFVELTTK